MTTRRESPDVEERREIARHNVLYRERRTSQLTLQPDDWEKFDRMAMPLSAYHASVLRLGDVHGKHVLDMGCGDGWFSVILAKRGARVTGFDIAVEAARTALDRGVANAVAERAAFVVASAYEMPFRDAAFDLVAGMAILHHVADKSRVSRELLRVLRPGGRAVFMEPLGESPLFERLRRMVPIPSEAEDDPDQWATQFKRDELTFFRPDFEVQSEVYHVISRLDRVTKSERVRRALGRIDRQLLRYLPPLRRLGRSIVVELRKSSP
jgi:SAM-dependent methyltransferase